MLSTFVNLLQSSTYQAYTYIFFHDETFRLQTYILMSWIKIDFFGMRLRSWSFRFFCNLLFASLFIQALWVSTSGILQISLDIHPKPKISFYDYLLDHNLIWVWIIISTESKESRAPYKEKFWETRLLVDSRGSTKKKVNLRYLP